jgi:hypothetical protein
MTKLPQFVVSFGFILMENAPQNMVAYRADPIHFGAPRR